MPTVMTVFATGNDIAEIQGASRESILGCNVFVMSGAHGDGLAAISTKPELLGNTSCANGLTFFSG